MSKFTEQGKQQSRLSILQRLKQKGMPSGPFPGKDPEMEATSSEEGDVDLPKDDQETLNDLGLEPDLEQRMNRARKKKPIPSGSL